jgi:hypothetical protein
MSTTSSKPTWRDSCMPVGRDEHSLTPGGVPTSLEDECERAARTVTIHDARFGSKAVRTDRAKSQGDLDDEPQGDSTRKRSLYDN